MTGKAAEPIRLTYKHHSIQLSDAYRAAEEFLISAAVFILGIKMADNVSTMDMNTDNRSTVKITAIPDWLLYFFLYFVIKSVFF